MASIVSRFNIPGKISYFIFNGDWVDRGPQQIEVVLSIFYSFILYPKRVILNRGNHEDAQQNTQWMYNPCLKQITDKYFGKFGATVYKVLDELFRHLPLACIINNPTQKQRFFVVHGGINKKLDLKIINKLDRTKFTTVCKPNINKTSFLETKHIVDVQDMLWSDPYPSDEENLQGERYNKMRNIGKHFGSDVTQNFLKKNNFTMIIRSHECKSQGFKLMHNDKLLTIFSASNYNHDNEGCIIKLTPNNPKFEVLTYMNHSKENNKQLSNKEDKLTKAIKILRTHLFKIRKFLLKDFMALDPKSTGVVTIEQFIGVLNKHLPNIPFVEIKDRICECDDNANKAKYQSLFDSVDLNSIYLPPELYSQNYEILQTIFNKIDVDSSGFITLNEFQNACKKAFKSLDNKFTLEQINKFMKIIDVNNDGKIDLQEFKNAFSMIEK